MGWIWNFGQADREGDGFWKFGRREMCWNIKQTIISPRSNFKFSIIDFSVSLYTEAKQFERNFDCISDLIRGYLVTRCMTHRARVRGSPCIVRTIQWNGRGGHNVIQALSRALALAVARARLTCETSAPAVARKHMVRWTQTLTWII